MSTPQELAESKTWTLQEAVDNTIRRGKLVTEIGVNKTQGESNIKLANFNFNAKNGPRPLNGTLPTLIAPLGSKAMNQLANKYDVNLQDLLAQGRDEGDIDGTETPSPSSSIPWHTFLSTDPSQPANYKHLVDKQGYSYSGYAMTLGHTFPAIYFSESMKLWESLLGIKFQVNDIQSLYNASPNTSSLLVMGVVPMGVVPRVVPLRGRQ